MAMIICPQCGKEISDRAPACPQCGFVMVKKEEIHLIKCDECGIEFDDKLDNCPNCGCPKSEKKVENVPQKVEVTSVSVNKKKVMAVIAIIVVIIGAVIGAFFIKQQVDNNKAKNYAKSYYENLKEATNTMLTGSAKAESAAGLIHDVWRNAIYEDRDDATDKYTRPNGYFVDDFNDALAELYKDASFTRDISFIESNQENVEKLMKKLKNPPEEYKEAYEDIKAFYDSYLEFTNLATNPTGSLTSYTESYNDLDADVSSKYKKMNMYIED